MLYKDPGLLLAMSLADTLAKQTLKKLCSEFGFALDKKSQIIGVLGSILNGLPSIEAMKEYTLKIDDHYEDIISGCKSLMNLSARDIKLIYNMQDITRPPIMF